MQWRQACDVRSRAGVSWNSPAAWPALILDLEHPELIERRLSVGLGPKADLACLGDRAVLDVEILLAVHEALDVIADHLDLERVPFAGRDLDLGVLEFRAALAADDLIDSEVIFERVHPRDVVVVGILVAPDDAAALVLLALVRLERDGHFDV